MKPSTYTAMTLARENGLPVLIPTQFEKTKPARGRVGIKVHRGGVAFGDIIRSGDNIIPTGRGPWTPGYDISGVVEETAPGSKLAVGDRVVAFTTTGGYAEYVEIDEKLVVPLPDDISFSNGCALVLNYLTGWQMLKRIIPGRPGPSSVLVTSAAGGVGSAVLQLCAYLGVQAFGAASAAKQDFVRELGAVPVERNLEDAGNVIASHNLPGVDAVLESRGFDAARNSQLLCRKGGTLILFGFLEHYHKKDFQRLAELFTRSLWFFLPTFLRRRKLFLIDAGKKNAWFREDMVKILELCREGHIKPVIDSVLPLSSANQAWQRLVGSQVRGKVLLSTEE